MGSLFPAAAFARNSINEKSEVGRFTFEPTNLAFGFISRDYHRE